MKKLSFFTTLLLCLLLITSCEEVGPDINAGNNGNNNSGSQERNILIEEFTGVKCANCPEGSNVIESLKNTYGDQLIPISIHAGFFASQHPESNYDFTTSEGDAIDIHLGSASLWPAASINRNTYEGTDLIVTKNTWAGYIALGLTESPKVEVVLNKTYDSASRILNVVVDLNFIENITEPLLVSIMITENNIIDTQSTPEGKDHNYSHKHVLRGMMTNALGNAYTGGTTNANDSGSQSFTTTLPNEWVEENCEIVAFVHSGTTKNVLQANAIHLTD